MRSVLSLLLLSSLAGCVCQDPPKVPADPAERVGRKRHSATDPQLVLFVVMDTVRADHTSLCGYERATTPALEGMVRSGATYTCHAYAPAPWTLPSHASYFTGKSVTEHATMFVSNSDVSINATITARPLADSFETLAEHFKAKGYQTVAISANSILNEASGLLQGFDARDVSTNGLTLRGRGLGQSLSTQLAAIDPERPLFLFVNIYDAHDPYPAIPPDAGFVPAQTRTKLDAYTKDPKNPYFSFIKGLMPEADKPEFLRKITDGYDYGVRHADANLSVVLTTLLQSGWMESPYRVVVASDHGEFLGEHDLLRHCGFVWEPVVEVPIVWFESLRRNREKLPDTMSAVDVYTIVRDGKLPANPLPPHTVSEKNPDDIMVGTIAGAVWSADRQTKGVCIEGSQGAYLLGADPGEANIVAMPEGVVKTELDKLCKDIDALHKLPVPKVDPSLTAALQNMGYADPDDNAPAEPLPGQ